MENFVGGSVLIQPEASRPTQAWIIIIIQCEKGPGVHLGNFTPNFKHYTRE